MATIPYLLSQQLIERMAEGECWNCEASISPRANYCSQCSYPVDPDHVYQEFVRAATLKEDVLENARGLLAEGIRNHHSEPEIREMVRELEGEDIPDV